MKYSALLSIGALAVSGAQGVEFVERSQPSVLNLDIVRKDTRTLSPASRDQLRLRKRTPLQVTLDNLATLYFANVTLGTPPQSLRLDIDTGSSDIWANSATSNLCLQSSCATSGTYDANKSSTYQYQNSFFSIQYADNSGAQGDYASDTLTLGGVSVANVPFGIGYVSSSAQGILGVGYSTNEAAVSTTGQTYQNLPLLLVSAKVTNTAAYSLWLNDLDANSGSILFGGVDTDKFMGNLQTLPIIQERGGYREFIVGLTSVKVAGQTVLSTPQAVLLDSGSSLSYLPTDVAQSIFSIFKATYSSSAGAAVVDCSYMNRAETIDFAFSGLTISVPMNEMVIVDGVRRGSQVCILGISDAAGSTSVLGDTFLRSAYVVYDITNNQISMAMTNFNATTSNIKEITTGSNGIPGASTVTGAVTTLSVTTGGARGPSVTAISPASSIKPALFGLIGSMIVAIAGVSFGL